MISSRKIDDLVTPAKLRALEFIHACKEAGYDLLVTSTYRDAESQNALFAMGRTVPGNPCSCGGRINPIGKCARHPLGLTVTNARGGDSFHQYRVALDVVPLQFGKPMWSTAGNGIDDDPTDDLTDCLEIWQRVGALGEKCGLNWAGRWPTFREFPHFQYTGGLTLADFKSGKVVQLGAA